MNVTDAKAITDSQFISKFRRNPHFFVKQSQTILVYCQEPIKLKDKGNIKLGEFGVDGAGSLVFIDKYLEKSKNYWS